MMRGTLSPETGVLLADLLSFLAQTQQSGCLSLDSGDLRASLNLRQGTVLNARFGELYDEDAIAAAITVPVWAFVLEPALRNSEKRIELPVSSLLLKCSVHADEERQAFDLSPSVLWYNLSAERTEGGASADDAELFRSDVDFLEEQVAHICQILKRPLPNTVGMSERGQSVAYRKFSDHIEGVVGLNTSELGEMITCLNEGE